MTCSFRTAFSAIALSTALMMGACGQKDKGSGPQISADVPSLDIKTPSDRVFAKHFDVPSRKVSEAEGEKALAALGLAESGSGDFTWAKRSGNDGNYVYTDLTSRSDDGTVTIAKAEIYGAHMEGETATFDRASFSGLSMKDDDVTINVKTMDVARPTPATAKAIMDGLKDMSSDDDNDMNIDEDLFGFGAMAVDDVTIIGEDVNGSIDNIMFGADETTNLADFKIEAIDLNIIDEKSKDVSVLKLSSLSAIGIRTDDMKKGFDVGRNSNGLTQFFGDLNMYQKPYDNFSLKGLSFDNDYVNFDMPNYSGQAKTKGDVTTITQSGDPIVIKLKDAPKDQQARQAYDMLKQLEFDEIKIRSSQTSILDKGSDSVRLKDGILEMEDGFKLNYTYGATGMAGAKAAAETAKAQNLSESRAMESVLSEIKLEDMKFSLEDQSIVERGMKLAEQMSGQPRSRMLAGMKAAVAMAQFGAKNDLEREMMTEGGSALLAFMEKGGTLTIEIDPDQPLPMSELMELQKNKGSLKAIGFSASQSN